VLPPLPPLETRLPPLDVEPLLWLVEEPLLEAVPVLVEVAVFVVAEEWSCARTPNPMIAAVLTPTRLVVTRLVRRNPSSRDGPSPSGWRLPSGGRE
jgi:hypothetical protein